MIELVKKYKQFIIVTVVLVLIMGWLFIQGNTRQEIYLDLSTPKVTPLPKTNEISIVTEAVQIEEKLNEQDISPNQEIEPIIPVKVPVYICGEVVNPGVYYVDAEAIVNELVLLSGGLTSEAEPHYLNLASSIVPNQKIYVPKRGEEIDKSMDSYENRVETIEEQVLANEASVQNNKTAFVNINSATEIQLMELPGIGPSKAKAIVTYRTTVQPFQSIEEITNVSGIGEKTFEKIKQLITI